MRTAARAFRSLSRALRIAVIAVGVTIAISLYVGAIAEIVLSAISESHKAKPPNGWAIPPH